MQWFAVENNSGGKHIPVWRRTYGIDPELKEIFIPAAMGAESPEHMVAVFAQGSGQKVYQFDEHMYVPLPWLKENYPKHADLMDMIEAHVKEKHTDVFPLPTPNEPIQD